MHWLIFVLVVAAFILGHNVKEMQETTQKLAMYPYHFILGNLVLLLVLVRIFFRKKDGGPAPANSSPLLNKVASLTHVLLNLSLIAVPVSGFVTVLTSGLLDAFKANDPNLVPNFHEVAAREFHEMFIGVLVLLLVTHIAATLYHQFIVKDNLLRRIMIRRFE
jgi:cytochrome b561